MPTINLTNHFYVKDHYELIYTVDSDPTENQTQVYVAEGALTQAQLQQKLLDAYVARETGVDFNYVVPAPATTPAPTQAELDIAAKQLEVNSARITRATADNKTRKSEEIALRISRIESYVDSAVDATILDQLKADLKSYTTVAAREYKTANDGYDTKRAELDALVNA